MFSFNAVKRKPCLFCGRRPFVAVVFVAKDQRRVLAPPGQVRGVVYTLCRRCCRKPGAAHRAGERILGDCDALSRIN